MFETSHVQASSRIALQLNSDQAIEPLAEICARCDTGWTMMVYFGTMTFAHNEK